MNIHIAIGLGSAFLLLLILGFTTPMAALPAYALCISVAAFVSYLSGKLWKTK